MKFSVLISVYKNDKPEFLKLAIDSIINQTVGPDEVVIVVDGPVDNCIVELLNDYKEKYEIFKIVFLEENLGLGNALAIGVNHCSYDLIARMDSDDISTEKRFEKQLDEFKKDATLSIVGGQIEEFIDVPSNTIGKRMVPIENEQIKEYIKSRCPFNHMTVMFRKKEIQKAGGYIEWHFNEDYYLWIRMYLSGCKFKNLSDTLVYARVGNEMYKRRGGMKYFKSEAEIQKYMFSNKMISLPRYMYNLMLRFTLQVLMPNKLRAFVFKKFARKENQ